MVNSDSDHDLMDLTGCEMDLKVVGLFLDRVRSSPGFGSRRDGRGLLHPMSATICTITLSSKNAFNAC